MRTTPLDFVILGIVAIAVHWPTWAWAVSFGIAVLLASAAKPGQP